MILTDKEWQFLSYVLETSSYKFYDNEEFGRDFKLNQRIRRKLNNNNTNFNNEEIEYMWYEIEPQIESDNLDEDEISAYHSLRSKFDTYLNRPDKEYSIQGSDGNWYKVKAQSKSLAKQKLEKYLKGNN